MPHVDERKMRILEDRIDALRDRDEGHEVREVMDTVFDRSTLMVLYKLISGGTLNTVEHPISSGKEAKVFRGTVPGPKDAGGDGGSGGGGDPGGDPGGDAATSEGEGRRDAGRGRREDAVGSVAVKIFLTTNVEFKNVLPYLHGDPRIGELSRDRRQLVFTWARKEFGNLRELREAGIRCPEPLAVEQNVLVMEYLGDETAPAPLLKDVELAEDQVREVFDDVAGQLETAYRDADLVHADVSQFNVLMWEGVPWIIDCGQAVSVKHPNAHEFLRRDLKNLCTYFRKLGLADDVADPDALFERFTRKDEDEPDEEE